MRSAKNTAKFRDLIRTKSRTSQSMGVGGNYIETLMSKEEFELKKLKLEVKKLELPWYRNIEFWKVLIPTIAVLLSLYFTFGKGLIDSEKSKLEIQKEQLKLDISRFEERRDKLADTIKLQSSAKETLATEIQKYERQKQELTNRINDLNKRLGISYNQITQITDARNNDRAFYQNKLKEQFLIEKSKLEELDSLTSILNNSEVKIAKLTTEINFLNGKAKLSEDEKLDLNILKLKAADKAVTRNMNKYDDKIKRLQQEYEIKKKKIDKMSTEELLREFEINSLKIDIEDK